VGTDWYGIGALKAIGAGTVVENSWIGWAGWQVLIYLGEIEAIRTWARYCHLKSASQLRVGDTVRLGDLIGVEGATGQAAGVHLHLEIYRGRVDRGEGANPGTTTDPRAFILARLTPPSPKKKRKKTMLGLQINDGAGRYGEVGARYFATYDGHAFVQVDHADANPISVFYGEAFANVTYAAWEGYKSAAVTVVDARKSGKRSC